MLEIIPSLDSEISFCKLPLLGFVGLIYSNFSDFFCNDLLELMFDLLHKGIVPIPVLIFLTFEQLLKREDALIDLLATALMLFQESISGEMRGLKLLDYSLNFRSKEGANCEFMFVAILKKVTYLLFNLKLLLCRSNKLHVSSGTFIDFMITIMCLNMQMSLKILVVEINATELVYLISGWLLWKYRLSLLLYWEFSAWYIMIFHFCRK